MNEQPWYRRWWAFVLRHKQIMIIDHQAHTATKSRRYYPVLFWTSVVVSISALAATMFLAGNYYKPFWRQQDLRPQYLQLQRLYQELRGQLNDAMTKLGVRDEQINMLKEEIKEQQREMERLRERLHLYDSLLAARKNKNVQLLQFTVHPLEEKLFDVSMTLVRGRAGKRHVKGWIKLFADDGKGKKVPLLLSNSKYKLPYRIESHAFLHETARWLQPAAPGKVFYAHVYDDHGKMLWSQEFSLEGKHANHVEKKHKTGDERAQPR